MTTPLVTIITPTHNHAVWIGTCIDSVRQQTMSRWEQIIIDDGSTDKTQEAIRPFLDDPRVKYVRQENRGIWRLSESYNRALSMSRGRFVAILEGDDFWPEDKLETQLPAFDDPEVGLSYGRARVADANGQLMEQDILRLNEWEPPYASFNSPEPLAFLRDLLMLRGNVGAVTTMLRRSALEEIGGFQQPSYFPAVDFPTLLKVATHHRAAFVDRPVGIWRHHPGQTTDVHGLQYVLGHTRVAVEYYHSLPPETQHALQIDEDDILRERRHYLANAYWRAARAAMFSKDWSQVRHHASGMIRWGHAFRRLEGVATLTASILHLDLNPVIERTASTRYGQTLVR